MTSTLDRYLIRHTVVGIVPDPEPTRLAEHDALVALVSATGGASCPFHEVGPVAAHLAGPVAAVPPEGHPDWPSLRSRGSADRSSRSVNGLINAAWGAPPTRSTVQCRCEGLSAHPLAVTMRHLSQGQIIRAHKNDDDTQARIQGAIDSGDVDRLVYHVEPRLDALKMLTDRARAEHGGDLPRTVADAAVTVAKTLTGPTRWDVRTGYLMHEWPPAFRWTAAAEKADQIMQLDFIHNAVIRRLVTGR